MAMQLRLSAQEISQVTDLHVPVVNHEVFKVTL